jgi:beta-fructofuranosidase
MVVAYPVDFEIGIFSSPNLIDWTPESNFSRYGLSGLQYECPNMVQVRVENATDDQPESLWAMAISINPGAPLGGSVTQYFLGSFNGTHYEPNDALTRLTDFAKDNYAGQFFYGIPADQDQISMAWASNWQYTNVVPTAGTLIQYPVNLPSVISASLASNASLGNGSLLVDYSSVSSGALYFEANITGLSYASLTGSLNFTLLSSVSGESVSGGINLPGDAVVWLDRGKTTAFENPLFTDKFSYGALFNPDSDGKGAFRLSAVVDRSIIELFVNRGEIAATSVFFPRQPLDTLIVRASGIGGDVEVSVGVWALRSPWEGLADANGTVVGNVTTGSGSGSGNGTVAGRAVLD